MGALTKPEVDKSKVRNGVMGLCVVVASEVVAARHEDHDALTLIRHALATSNPPLPLRGG